MRDPMNYLTRADASLASARMLASRALESRDPERELKQALQSAGRVRCHVDAALDQTLCDPLPLGGEEKAAALVAAADVLWDRTMRARASISRGRLSERGNSLLREL